MGAPPSFKCIDYRVPFCVAQVEKVKFVQYTFVGRGVSVRETYPEPSDCGVGLASSFPRRLYLPSVTSGYPLAAG